MPSSKKQEEFDRQLDLLQIREFRKTGNLEILGELYHKYMHLVYGLCLKYLKNRADAQDAVMQIFEKLTIESVKQEIYHFRSWLYVVSKNHCLLELRKKNSENDHLKKMQLNEQSFVENDFEMHPLDEEKKMTDALYKCIEKLKKEQQQSIRLFYLQKKCYREIAHALQCDEKSVKSFIQNGKRNLKICLETNNGR
ncbi:MAG: sigma-70 family RNA polymerase sigma factor [Prolixibacteraceae bacterium]|nr:sigma-70 family RNA polymerase sigma factor [Prolixibacteraceae bacterium]